MKSHCRLFFAALVTRAVGLDDHVDLEITPVEVHPGDLFLLCSDGLTKMLTDAAIVKLLKKQAGATDLDGLAQGLVDAANAAGGEDNVSVVSGSGRRYPAASPRRHAGGGGAGDEYGDFDLGNRRGARLRARLSQRTPHPRHRPEHGRRRIFRLHAAFRSGP